MKYHIYGHSIEACLTARQIVSEGHDVVFHATEALGKVEDHLGDFILEQYAELILKYSLQIIPLPNALHVHVPYELIKFNNSTNGLMKFPLTRMSFESKNDADVFSTMEKEIIEFVNDTSECNFINNFKSLLPKQYYDVVWKHMGLNRWGLRHSQMSRWNYIKELGLSDYSKKTPYVLWKPRTTYGDLCADIIEHPSIELIQTDIRELKKIWTNSKLNKNVLVMDNRVDWLCDYRFGLLERKRTTKVVGVDVSNYENFLSNGFIFTPHDVNFGIKLENGIGTSYSNEDSNELSLDVSRVLSPSLENSKYIDEYSSIVSRYRDRNLLLPKSVTLLKV